MPIGKDDGNKKGGSQSKKNAFCSFCRKSYRDVGPLVEGPGDVYICGECIELCTTIIDTEPVSYTHLTLPTILRV